MNSKQTNAANELYKLLISLGWEREKAIKEAEATVMSYTKVKPAKTELYRELLELVKSYKLQPAINEEIYRDLREKYYEKLVFWWTRGWTTLSRLTKKKAVNTWLRSSFRT